MTQWSLGSDIWGRGERDGVTKNNLVVVEKPAPNLSCNGPSHLSVHSSHPEVTVNRDLLKQKMSAATKPAQIKGLYDLLVQREDQAKYSGKGKGDFEAVPHPIFSAMKGSFSFHFFFLSFVVIGAISFFLWFVLEDFFQAKWGADHSVLITECINEKACQARSAKKRAQKPLAEKQ